MIRPEPRPALGSATTHARYYLVSLYAIWTREVKGSVRESGQLVGAFSRPLIWVIIFGVGLTPYFRTGLRETTFVVPFTYMQYFPAVVVLNILYPSIQSSVSLNYDRQFGFFREVFASPVPRSAVFLGKLLGGATVATLQGGLVLGPYVDVPMPPQVLPYKRAGWAKPSTTAVPKHLAVLTNHWSLAADDAFGWADARNVEFLAHPSAADALAALKAGKRDSVLGLADEVAWMHGQLTGRVVRPVDDLPEQTLGLGLWKNTITLRRVMVSVLGRQGERR